jgi:predicted murein hydrolase (TIGR00659 family)
MWTELLASPLFGIGLTLGFYAVAQKVYQRTGNILFTPVALAILLVIGFLLLLRIPYEHYAVGGRYIHFLLGPSVVALGIPLYSRRRDILNKKGPILLGVAAGSVTSIITASGIAWLLGASPDVVISMAPKSVTTPIAIGIVEKIGGIPPLTAVIVVLTGCLGAVCGPEFCRLLGIRESAAMGLAVGTSAHGIGTARMLEIDRLGGAFAGLAIGLNGLITAFILPLAFFLFR